MLPGYTLVSQLHEKNHSSRLRVGNINGWYGGASIFILSPWLTIGISRSHGHSNVVKQSRCDVLVRRLDWRHVYPLSHELKCKSKKLILDESRIAPLHERSSPELTRFECILFYSTLYFLMFAPDYCLPRTSILLARVCLPARSSCIYFVSESKLSLSSIISWGYWLVVFGVVSGRFVVTVFWDRATVLRERQAEPEFQSPIDYTC